MICYTADSLLKKIKDKATLQGIMEGRIVLLSVAKPDAGFNVGMAMMRNKYIYAQSDGTVVVRSDKGKGGTWAGAVENLASDPIWCLPFCWNKEYEGNQALIEKGCIPIDENWDVDLKMARHQYIAKSEKNTASKGRTGTIVAETDDNSMGDPMQLNLLDLVEE